MKEVPENHNTLCHDSTELRGTWTWRKTVGNDGHRDNDSAHVAET